MTFFLISIVFKDYLFACCFASRGTGFVVVVGDGGGGSGGGGGGNGGVF